MSTGGFPDVNRLLEDENEEDETASEGGTEETEGREHADSGEEDGEGTTGDEGETFEEEASPDRSDLGGNRRANRIRNLNRRLQESTRRNEDLERRLSQLEQGGQQRQQRQTEQETQEQDNARMALMSPEERMQFTLDRGMARVNAMMQNAQVSQAENSDRAAFQNLTTTDRLARRFAPQVEELFQTLKSQGRMTAREIILNYLIGQAARQQSGSPQNRNKRRQAERNIERNRGSGSSGRSDVGGERSRRPQTLEQRLEGKLI